MKELHLICNSHIDPVWQWDWNEGASAALATFYSAVELAEEYDYIFCHNEALLYEYVERYDIDLFKKIQALVKKGKWHIMGGWYIQPDCTIPSGEGFIRQIETGRKYFKEKFGVSPRVAVNFDSFGHTQGLVQILKKCGYDGYIFCRPMKELLSLPNMTFTWQGFDGSTVKAVRGEDISIYSSHLGTAVQEIKRKAEPWKDEDIALILWGVGNHGGGASRKDLNDIKEFQQQEKGVKIIHSTPENYFDKVDSKVTFNKALEPVFVKCYTSDARLKQKYAELENKLFITEKICSVSAINGLYYPNSELFNEIQKCLSRVQFHDVLSGTSIYDGEQSSLRCIDHALELLQTEYDNAFFALIKNEKPAVPEEFPIYVFNANPSKVKCISECEIIMGTAICDGDKGYEIEVKKDGEIVPSQIIKERSNINFDRRKAIAIESELNSLSLTRFDIKVKQGKRFFVDRTPQLDFNGKGYSIKFNKESGCLCSYVVNGKEYLKGDSFIPIMYDDNPDPWGWWLKTVGTNYIKMKAVIVCRVVEKGQLFTALESTYELGKSTVNVKYKIYKSFPYIDIKTDIILNDEGKGIKIEILPLKEDKFIGQTSYGIQTFEKEQEQCSQRFCAVGNDDYFTVLKNGCYGCSVESGKLYINVLNASVYCAHPVGKLPIIDDKRFNQYIELGRHDYSFRFTVGKFDELEKFASEFINEPIALNVYPHGKGQQFINNVLTISDKNIVLSALRSEDNGKYLIRLYNGSDSEKQCRCKFLDSSLDLSFIKYEVKTIIFDGEKLYEKEIMI